MDAFGRAACSNSTGLVGSIISLALVFGGGSVFAEGVTGLASPGSLSPAMIGEFSDVDLAGLEHASAADATAARLAVLGAASGVETSSRNRPTTLGDVGQEFEGEVFTHSSRLLPLLVAQPEAAPIVAKVPAGPRPGSVRPVGVTVSSLRSPTPSERSGR